MRNSYTQVLCTGVKNLCDSLKHTLISCMYLTQPIRSILAGEPLPRIARRSSLVLLAGLLLFSNLPASQATTTQRDKETYKLYAHIKLFDAKQYRCLEVLWMRESKWDPKADNPKSSAYGIPQLLKMKELDPFKQIDLGIKYIIHKHRTPCKALEYHNKRGFY